MNVQLNDILDQVTVEGTTVSDNTTVPSFVGGFPEIFDSSMLASAKACMEQFRLGYIQHWKPKAVSVHLHAGASFAKGLEVARKAFYTGEIIGYIPFKYPCPDEGCPHYGTEHEHPGKWHSIQREPQDSDTAIALGLRALLAAYGDFQCPPDSAKSAERTAGAFEFYFDNYPLSHDDGYPIELPGGQRGIEFSFAHPLPILHPVTGNPLLYVGRMDAIIQYAGSRYICDEKTTTQLGASWPRQWDLRSQFTGYAWGAREAGIEVEGAIVRGVSILKTKYDTAQSINYRPQWQIDRWYNELLEWIEDLKASWALRGADQPWRHNLDHSCAEYGGCQFREACLSQDKQPWLETAFERRMWNPLLREEVKK